VTTRASSQPTDNTDATREGSKRRVLSGDRGWQTVLRQNGRSQIRHQLSKPVREIDPSPPAHQCVNGVIHDPRVLSRDHACQTDSDSRVSRHEGACRRRASNNRYLRL